MKTVEVHDPQHFDETIKKVLAEGSHLLVLFEGEEDSTGQSWCSDCRKGLEFFIEYIHFEWEFWDIFFSGLFYYFFECQLFFFFFF